MHTAIVVDDELITRLDFSGLLKTMDFEILGMAADGFDAVELCRHQRPDLILMDLEMPVFDGVSAVERILQEDLAGSVVVITAYSDEQTISRMLQAGVSGYLIKPVERSDLFASVHLALASRRQKEKLLAQIHDLETTVAETKIIERAKAQMAASQGISESEAYRRLQKLAMDKRCSMGALAHHLLESSGEYELTQRAKQLLMQEQKLSEKEAYRRLQTLAQQKGCTMEHIARSIVQTGGGR